MEGAVVEGTLGSAEDIRCRDRADHGHEGLLWNMSNSDKMDELQRERAFRWALRAEAVGERVMSGEDRMGAIWVELEGPLGVKEGSVTRDCWSWNGREWGRSRA